GDCHDSISDELLAHLLGKRSQADAYDLVLDLHDIVTISVGPSLTPTHPGGSQQVAPLSPTTVGPLTRSGSPAWSSSGGAGRTSAVRTATSSIARARSA